MEILCDALQELAGISLQLENRDMSLAEEHRNICLHMLAFESMVNKSGTNAIETAKAAPKMTFLKFPFTTDIKVLSHCKLVSFSKA